ncbi:MAG TPA: serine hydrolase domain-containing protein, partial [Pseudonocardiaceae bacterium]|nr:serine hydrolase domain-containing protein [Pseudonocardiaceae bacterium]
MADVVHGTCETRFDEVLAEFERNFAQRGEVGASVHVTVDGQSVVDLWGGVADPEIERPWTENTVTHVWSCTKGATALCAHLLAARGQLDLNAPVVRYWPEFGAAGKENVLVRHLLSHQAGLPALREAVPKGAFYDWDYMVGVLADAEPFWTPGTRHGYHGMTFGFLVGEVVRRVSGVGLGEFFRREIADPLELDFWLGLPEEVEDRVAPTLPPDLVAPGVQLSAMYQTAMTDHQSIPGLMMLNNGGYLVPGESDTREAHLAVMGAVGGITGARGLAGLYRPVALDGSFGPVRLFPRDYLPILGMVASAALDAAILAPTRFGLGFVKSVDNRYLPGGDADSVILSEDAFGHSGFGGSLGFADPR